MSRPTVALVGTLDTKGKEYQWAAQRLHEHGVDVLVVNAGVRPVDGFSGPVHYAQDEMARAAGTSLDALRDGDDRGAAARVQRMRDAAVAVNPEVLVLCHGGPIAEPPDARYILAHTTGVVGFFGASSVERLPAERAITQQVVDFKSIPLS